MTRKLIAIGVLLGAAIPGFVWAQQVDREMLRLGLAVVARSNPDILVRAQLALEKRRAGGPRPKVVARLLERDRALGDPEWLLWVLDECRSGGLRCVDYVKMAEEQARRADESVDRPGGEYFRRSADHVLSRFREEAGWQELSEREKRRLIEYTLTHNHSLPAPMVFNAPEAALRTLDEAYLDLLPLIEKAIVAWPSHSWGLVSQRLEVVRAAAGDPTGRGLFKLINDAVGVEAKVSTVAAATEEDRQAQSQARGLVFFALQELRRLNPADAGDELKTAAMRDQAVKAIVVAAEHPESPQAALVAKQTHPLYIGSTAEMLAEAVGDFGDRGFERLVLGDACLSNQLAKAEKELVAAGLLKADEAVAVK